MTEPSRLLFPLLLPLLAAAASASTLAISGGGDGSYPPTVCGIAEFNGTVLCASLAGTNTTNASVYSAAPFLAFAEVSAGGGTVCGLTAGSDALFCWPAGEPGELRRVYNGLDRHADLAVGADHIAAYDETARRVVWWREGTRFPAPVTGAFRSLVSGDGFSCAVEGETGNNYVRCWGPRGSEVQQDFANSSGGVSYLAAGGTRACGVEAASGAVRCSGMSAGGASAAWRTAVGDLNPYGMAVGDHHACGLRRADGTAVCWSLLGPGTASSVYYPAFGTKFVSLAAGGNFTCGVADADFSVLCWSSASAVTDPPLVPLKAILPGVCGADPSACGECGFFPQSAQYCARSGGGVICDRLCSSGSSPPPVSSPPRSSPPTPAPAPPSSGRRGVSKRWIAFVVVGSVGSFAGLCSIVYCLVFGFCSNKRVHNSVQPNIAAAAPAAADSNNNNGSSPYGSPNGSGSRTRSLFRRQLSRVMTRQRSGPSSFKDPAEEFSFAALEAATGGFAPEAKIGEGSFGAVYRGKLADGREVAIKRGGSESEPRRFQLLHQLHEKAPAFRLQDKESAFRSELAFLSRLHHKHLVGLVGYCEEGEERLLVYEFMKNGALYDHLHPKGAQQTPSSASPVATSWKLRIKVLLDASRGIEYLHSYAVPPIIHRDIKSSNILLDATWTARVSDFGLSLMGPESEDETAPQSVTTTRSAAVGTVGYIDPEYYGLRHLTTKSDVYGFGVVMLEALTGRPAIFPDPEGGTPASVVDHAVPSIVAGELAKVLDPRAPEPAAPHEAEAVELVAYTAVHCVRLEGKDRPAMADVVANLETAFALCEGSAAGGGFGNSSSSNSVSVASVDRSGALV